MNFTLPGFAMTAAKAEGFACCRACEAKPTYATGNFYRKQTMSYSGAKIITIVLQIKFCGISVLCDKRIYLCQLDVCGLLDVG